MRTLSAFGSKIISLFSHFYIIASRIQIFMRMYIAKYFLCAYKLCICMYMRESYKIEEKLLRIFSFSLLCTCITVRSQEKYTDQKGYACVNCARHICTYLYIGILEEYRTYTHCHTRVFYVLYTNIISTYRFF